MPQITCLPPELLVLIISHLDFRAALRCRQVCHILKSLIDSDIHVQYKIELAAAGMEDGAPSAITPTDRLNILREQQSAWKRLDWNSVTEIPMREGGVWELYGGVLAQAEGSRTLVFDRLPSVCRGIQHDSWTIQDVGVEIRDFGMDPSQDLLVLIEEVNEGTRLTCKVHLRSLTTGAKHPAAQKSELQRPLGWGHQSYAIQTSEDLLGILINSDEEDTTELLVWNWKTGAVRLHISANELPSFGFLTSRYVILGIHSVLEPDAEVAAPNFFDSDAQLMVIDLDAASDQPVPLTELDYLCSFHYPELKATSSVLAMSLRSDPGPHWQPPASQNVPFSTARVDRLFVVTIFILHQYVHRPLLSFVPASTLLKHIDALAPGTSRIDIPWDAWGTAGSRFLLAPPTHTTVWVCYVHGMTFATMFRRGPTQIIMVFNFNQLDIRRTSMAPGYARGQNEPYLVDDMYKSDVVSLFKKPVERSTLVHWSQGTTLDSKYTSEGHFSAVMVAEDSLVLVYSQSHIRKYRVLTF